jgi:hypothetical protein
MDLILGCQQRFDLHQKQRKVRIMEALEILGS